MNMMHELLEHLDFETIRNSISPQKWLEKPRVRAQIDTIRQRHQRSEETVPIIAEIIWNTMNTPVRLGRDKDSEQVELASCEQNLREADFYFPIPSDLQFLRTNSFSNLPHQLNQSPYQAKNDL